MRGHERADEIADGAGEAPARVGPDGASAPQHAPSTRRLTTDAASDEPRAASACGCGAGPSSAASVGADEGERHAAGVDPAGKARNLKRLRRIEGQVRGLQRMVEEDRYCADVMTQIASVHEALRAVGRELMRNHLRHCATQAIRGSDEAAEGMYDELLDRMYRSVR